MEREKRVLPLIPLRGLTIFPNMVIHFDVGREKSIAALEEAMLNGQYIALCTQKDVKTEDPKDDEIYEVGTLASIKQILKLPGESVRVLVEGEKRVKILEYKQYDPYIMVEVEIVEDDEGEITDEHEALMRMTKDLFSQYVKVSGVLPPEVIANVEDILSPGRLGDVISSYISLNGEKKQEILESIDEKVRLENIIEILKKEIDIIRLEKKLNQKVKKNIDKVQKEYYLKEQLKVIQEELGEDDEDKKAIKSYKSKIAKAKMPKEVKEKALSEVNRLKTVGGYSSEGGVIKSYLDWLVELPWSKETKDILDVEKAKKVLDDEHYGLKDVKERILEYIAVKSISKSPKGPILCLVGPPGVGKTSIARSIAKAVNRNFVRMSLGGVNDEADIRGHRKTYIGAIPGRIIYGLKQAGSKNPLFLLDEIDKISNSYKGNPADALLEVLDAEQNATFRDHYLEVDFDLSKVMFIITANTLETIPRPLLDRMEVIEVSGYTTEEKFNIAKKHLVPKELKEHDIEGKIVFSDKALYSIIENYTRESGVRNLERKIARVIRRAIKEIVEGKKKKINITINHIKKYLGEEVYRIDEIENKDKVGVVNGMAWTAYGGDTLPVEAVVMPGNGKLILTGQLGDVMQESAKAAFSYVRANCEKYGIDVDFYKNKDIHIHAPEGAVPKDGPSAGVAMITSMVSALSGRPVRHNVAMTGEITLTGKVLPIGGLKEKTLASYRAGIDTIIIPKKNKKDLDKVPKNVLNNIKVITAEEISTVLENAIIGGK